MSAIYKALTQKDTRSPKAGVSKGPHRVNKQRVLLISSRGVTFRHRHLINDLNTLLPHSRKEPKLDTKKTLYELNELADLYNCNNIMYFECRKHKDLYMWLSKPPNGPTIKFFIQNLHTMDELNFTGNCLKGSRPILSFDQTFETDGRYRLMKEMFIHQFGVPPHARKSKPFVDHVMTFSILDGKIWIRNYQINESKESQTDEEPKKESEDLTLVEIGPRLVLTPIIILEGSFGGPKIYENRQYVSPNLVRAQLKVQAAEEARGRQQSAEDRKLKKREQVLKVDPLSNDVIFKE
ncbi:DEKNAAC103006 [Brettanomyces naardenensis]|uniref:DEKNAAC103006 n=1 Tax=Brettanomyces naardenensis TaxID=13370 RepID=A0A448YM81_BRENA|nr:DEKNAAC103006 [Brettanomyces naardenensis]